METFEIIAQKSKKRNIKRMVKVAVGVVFLGFIINFVVHVYFSKQASNHLMKLVDYYEIREEIAYPNIESIDWGTRSTGEHSGIYHSNRVKDLDGVLVDYNDVNGVVDVSISRVDDAADAVAYIKGAWYTNQGLLKSPVFYNIRNKERDEHAKPVQELPLVKQMKGQLVEVALTFDKPYSYEELTSLLPANLKKNWYWLGTSSDRNTAGFLASELYGLRDPANKFETFREYLKRQMDSDFARMTINQGEYDSRKEWNYLYNAYPTLESAKFFGVILTGKAENVAQLEGKDWIYASSIGASTPNQPYYHLEKE